jgi:tetratricopeptide (TPR) repeat protein
MVYYANRGDLEAFERYSHKVEVHAIQRGTAWQVETWKYSGLMYIHLRTGDAAGLKDCAEQLKRISADVPSLVPEYARAQASYLVLRGTPAEALRVMDETPEEPCERVGWSRCEGVRARALNDLGEHAQARATCLRALEYLTDEDLAFTGNNLGLLIELARADAGLQDFAAAEARLNELIDEHRQAANPLTLGTLHEALAKIAALRGDREAFAANAREVDHWFRATRHPALVARCERLSKRQRPAREGADSQDSGGSPQLQTVLHNLRHGGDSSIAGSAQWALRQLSELTDLSEAYLFVQETGGIMSCVASVRGNGQEHTLGPWVHEQLETLNKTMATRTLGVDELDALDSPYAEIAGKPYRLVVLRPDADSEKILGALVVPRDRCAHGDERLVSPHQRLRTKNSSGAGAGATKLHFERIVDQLAHHLFIDRRRGTVARQSA